MFRRGDKLWIRSPIGFVWRNLEYPADRAVQLHPVPRPFSYWRAVLALQRSNSPILRADVSSWEDDTDSDVECDVLVSFFTRLIGIGEAMLCSAAFSWWNMHVMLIL